MRVRVPQPGFLLTQVYWIRSPKTAETLQLSRMELMLEQFRFSRSVLDELADSRNGLSRGF